MRKSFKPAMGWLVIGILLISPGCRQENKTEPTHTTVRVNLESNRPAMNLSDYGLFQDLANQIPSPGVVPYQLNVTSFLDQAITQSFLWVPPNEIAQFRPDRSFEFPIGTILVQNIRFPIDLRDPSRGDRLVETRLLIHRPKGWTGVPYLWNEQQTDALRAVIGDKTEVTIVQQDGNSLTFPYLTPNMNQCKRCHMRDELMVPIGVTARNLNRRIETEQGQINQLDHWNNLGKLAGLLDDRNSVSRLPDWRDAEAISVNHRARAWLDVNCSHCHNPQGPASVTGLDLSFGQDEPVRFGVYKPPVAAGRGSSGHRFSILPHHPEQSFLLHRVESNELGVMMPTLGRSLSDLEGADLIRQWITEMPENESLAEAALNPMKAYREAISGGDAERGKLIFHKTQKCVVCHKVGDEGGTVGPNLSDVGTRTKPEYLLESIVDPNANIVKGFQTEVAMTDDGRIVTGVIQSEDEYEVVIANSEKSTKLLKENIEERFQSSVSTMPTVANLLTVDQVRDLIAYLVTLRDPSASK